MKQKRIKAYALIDEKTEKICNWSNDIDCGVAVHRKHIRLKDGDCSVVHNHKVVEVEILLPTKSKKK